MKEFQDGKHEGSILSIATVDSLAQDERETWRAIRKELEDIGISIAAFDANKDFIMGWFQKAVSAGAFDEQIGSNDLDSDSATDSVLAQRYLTPSLTKVAQDSSPFKRRRQPRVITLFNRLRGLDNTFIEALALSAQRRMPEDLVTELLKKRCKRRCVVYWTQISRLDWLACNMCSRCPQPRHQGFSNALGQWGRCKRKKP